MLINKPGFELDAARAIDDRDHTDPLNYLVAKSFSVYYNGMLYPTLPYTFRGVIWYQGESQGNTAAESLAYRRHFPLMIQSWRDAFQEPNLPFYFVQLPRGSEGPYASDRAPIRESQLLSERDLPNTGMVVTMDVIDFTVDGQSGVYPSPLDGADYGLHPPFKMPIGLRLSAMARKLTYGENVAYTAPRVSDISVDGSKMVITFDHTSGGLISRDGQALRHFTICDTAPALPTGTATFVAADAVIVGNTVEVSATGITHPIAVRYAWRNDANLNLYWTQDPGSYNPASYDPVNDDPAEYGPTDPRVSVWTKFFAISPFRSDAFEIAGNTRDRNFVADGDVYWVVNVDPTDPDTCYAVIANSTTLTPQTRTVSFDEGTESGVWHVYDQVTGESNTLGAIGSNKAALNLSIPAGGERVLRLVRAGDVETYSTYAAGINWGGADSSEAGDAEGDGRNNRFEYAFGSDPLSGADAPALRGQAVEEAGRQYLKLSYFENVLASDLSYSFQQSHNLTNWSLFVPAPEDVTVTPVAGSVYQKVTIRVPISGGASFLKVGAQ